MKSDINNYMFFDIETIGTEDKKLIKELFPMPERRSMEDAPSNYKKEEAIAKWVEREYLKDIDKRTKAINNGALDIDTAVIRSIAWAVGNEAIECVIGDERTVLLAFLDAWSTFRSKTYKGLSCGFNSINYDWSVILRRTAVLGMGDYLLTRPNMNRYSGEVDLINIAYNFGYSAGKIKSMKTLAKVLKITIPAGDVSGKDVKHLTDEELFEYNVSDVYITREIFKKFNGVYL